MGSRWLSKAGPAAPVHQSESSTFNWNPTDPTVLPDLLIEASQPLGNGSLAVCDDRPRPSAACRRWTRRTSRPRKPWRMPSTISRVVSKTAAVRRADAARRMRARSSTDGSFHFVFPPDRTVTRPSTIQFCGLIDSPSAFPTGNTLITARIRDLVGNVSSSGPAHHPRGAADRRTTHAVRPQLKSIVPRIGRVSVQYLLGYASRDSSFESYLGGSSGSAPPGRRGDVRWFAACAESHSPAPGVLALW